MLAAYQVFAAVFTFWASLNCPGDTRGMRLQIWRSGSVQSPVTEEIQAPVVNCLVYEARCDWHFGEIASCHALMDEAISTAKELNDRYALGHALNWAAGLGYDERNPGEVHRLASDLIELSTRHNFLYLLTEAAIYRGLARSASGKPAEGILWIEQGIRDLRASGSMLPLSFHLGHKAEALHLAGRTLKLLRQSTRR